MKTLLKCLWLACFVQACVWGTNAYCKTSLTIGAAASLGPVSQDLVSTFEKANPDTELRLVVAGSQVIARQIKAGASIDIIFSADEETVTGLAKAKLVDARSIIFPVRNQVVVALAPEFAKSHTVKEPKDLTQKEISKIAIGTDTVPIGRYARKFLTYHKLEASLLPKMVEVENVRAALALVEKNRAQVAFVYESDLALAKPAVPLGFAIPEEQTGPVRYAAAATNKCRDQKICEKFLKYLMGSEAQTALRKFGFRSHAP